MTRSPDQRAPDQLASLSLHVTVTAPLIMSIVVKAEYGEPAMRKVRLDAAIRHAQDLLDGLKSARLTLDVPERKGDVA